MSNPFDPLDNEVTRAFRILEESTRIANTAQVDRINRMVEDAMQATKPMVDAVQQAVAHLEATTRPIIEEAARAQREHVATLTSSMDRSMAAATRQVQQQMDAVHAAHRQMEAITAVTRNLGYRW